MNEIMKLCDLVRETSFAIHCYHRSGHLEKIYENALVHRLRKHSVNVRQNHPVTVYDEDGTVLGNLFADLLVENWLVVELKACKSLTDEHIAQLFGYLKAIRLEHGMLINFGAPKLQVRKFIFTPGYNEPQEY